jgi:hypothetical protein
MGLGSGIWKKTLFLIPDPGVKKATALESAKMKKTQLNLLKSSQVFAIEVMQ